MAKPTKDRVPLASHWTSIKSGNETLKKSPLFKPDIIGPIKKYDQALLNYAKQLTDKDKLNDCFKSIQKTITDTSNGAREKAEALNKVENEGRDKLTKNLNALFAHEDKPDADMTVVSGCMTNLSAEIEESITLHRAISDQIYSLKKQSVASLNKVRDEYKAKASAITSAMNKIDSEVLSLEVQIRGIISTYSKIAISMNHADASDAARELLGKF
jgi:hypothetical protein